MMKKLYFSVCSLSLLAVMTSCKDEYVPTPADEGAEVHFGAALEAWNTRTYYGPETNNTFPIYWNTEEKGFDKIFIHAPNAIAGRNSAYYEVKPASADQKEPAAIVKLGETGIQWGKEATKFYGFYPGNEKFNLKAEGTSITATLPGNQSVGFTDMLDPVPLSVDPNKLFEAIPDMSCLMMTAETNLIAPTNDMVSLQFSPLSTVLDITINGPAETNTITPVYVTSVSVEADAQITGEFTYDFPEDGSQEGKITANSSNEGDKSIQVKTMGENTGGDIVGVPLHIGQKLNLKVFMIPNPNITKLTVSITTSDFLEYKKDLNVSNLKPRMIHKVNMPKFLGDEVPFNFETWMSQLDPRIYISEISLPGSALSFNINGVVQAGNNYITQNQNIENQFKNGIRAFQGHIWPGDAKSDIDNTVQALNIVTSQGTSTGITLVEAIRALRTQMEGVHSEGFCVLCLSDYKPNTTNYTHADLYKSINAITNRMQELGIVPFSAITPNTTLQEVKGKIIVKLQLLGGDSNRDDWQYLNDADALFNVYTETANTKALYSPLTFGNPPTKLFSSDDGKNDIKGNPIDLSSNMWFIYGEQANAGNYYDACIANINNVVNALNSTYDQETHNKFYMTYCGGNGGREMIFGFPTGTNHSVENIATDFAQRWITQSENITGKPFGWVMFNRVQSNTTVVSAIQKVLSRNNGRDFKLNRNRKATAPTGDIKGVNNGGNLF